MSLEENLCFILVEPQMGENIGAVARVISNFGFTKLRLVSPRDGWPNIKANELAAHGRFVLEQAEIFDSFNKAISDINFLVATSAQRRDMEKESCDPHALAIKLTGKLLNESKVGILLGRERSGLTNEEIIAADMLCSINTSKINSSLNIAQAASIIAYELSITYDKAVINKINQEPLLAPKAEMELFFQHLKQELDKKNFFKTKEKEQKMFQNIRNTFIKAKMTEQEVRTFRGIIKTLVQ